MILFKKTADLGNWVENQRKKENRVGFVPTMGALHDGHISLVNTSKNMGILTVASIFINPTQFNDPKDFQKYPVTVEKDISLLEEAGSDVLFLPSTEEIYPDGLEPKIHYELGYLEEVLEGKFRPGHFQGVCGVVHRLLEIVKPDYLFLGQKDYQQCMVINKLLEIMNGKISTEIIICPTLREPDGLAMSSRNMRLDARERKKATAIYRCLCTIKENAGKESPGHAVRKAKTILEEAGFTTDYVEIADAIDLSPAREWKSRQKLVALVAAYMNEVRLIDNLLIN